MTNAWIIDAPSWPVTPQRDDELTAAEVLDVLDEFPRHYRGALASLAETEIPTSPTEGAAE